MACAYALGTRSYVYVGVRVSGLAVRAACAFGRAACVRALVRRLLAVTRVGVAWCLWGGRVYVVGACQVVD